MLVLLALSCATDASVVALVDADTPRLQRLTHDQWEWSVRSLLALDAPSGQSEGFLGNTLSPGFDNDTEILKVGAMQFQDYQRAAEVLAAELVADPARYALVAAEVLGGDVPGWVARFGAQAWRRPLTADEVATWSAAFAEGRVLVASGDTDRDGVQTVVQGMLQSPWFLYRVETGAPGERLSGHELAAKLSLALWDRPPDAELLADVERLQRNEVLERQVDRLLAHQRAEAPILRMHEQVFRLDDYENIAKVSPEWDPELSAMMLYEAQATLEEVLFTEKRGFRRLMTADFTIANGPIAALYGREGSQDFARIDLDPSQRSGLLTLSGFLTLLAEDDLSNPIQRGSFVVRELLCLDLPPPPDETTGLGPVDPTVTNRERVDRHTGEGTCGEGCHSAFINPAGFAFEHYDGLGRWRDTDHGFLVDASASMVIDGRVQSYANAVEFAALLSTSPQVHQCYAGKVLEHTFARSLEDEDEPLLESLTQSSLEGASTLSMVRSAVTSEAFRCNR